MRLAPHTNIWICPFCKGQMDQPRKIERGYVDSVQEYEADAGIAELVGLHMFHEHAAFTRTPIQTENDLPYIGDDND